MDGRTEWQETNASDAYPKPVRLRACMENGHDGEENATMPSHDHP
jgi:hypothetical protein